MLGDGKVSGEPVRLQKHTRAAGRLLFHPALSLAALLLLAVPWNGVQASTFAQRIGGGTGFPATAAKVAVDSAGNIYTTVTVGANEVAHQLVVTKRDKAGNSL